MLDILVVAPHPDDAELGMAGTIMCALAEGLKVGILDLTSGEPTPFGTPEIRARETAAASEVLQISWRENLGLENRKLEHTLEARARLAGVFRRVRPRHDLRPLLGRRASRSRRGDRFDRSGAVLVEAHQDRPAGRAVSPLAHPLLPLPAPARGRRHRHWSSILVPTGSASVPRSSATTASSSRGASSRRRISSTAGAIMPPSGAGRSGSSTASRSPVANRSVWPACATCCNARLSLPGAAYCCQCSPSQVAAGRARHDDSRFRPSWTAPRCARGNRPP